MCHLAVFLFLVRYESNTGLGKNQPPHTRPKSYPSTPKMMSPHTHHWDPVPKYGYMSRLVFLFVKNINKSLNRNSVHAQSFLNIGHQDLRNLELLRPQQNEILREMFLGAKEEPPLPLCPSTPTVCLLCNPGKTNVFWGSCEHLMQKCPFSFRW